MNDHVLLELENEVVVACKALIFAADDIRAGLESAPLDSDRAWYGVQNLVVAAGNLSKCYWGGGRLAQRERRAEERRPLREKHKIRDDSPLRDVAIRNDYEHIDERIEVAFSTERSVYVGAVIGPEGGFGWSGDEQSVLRWLDPQNGNIIFWGNRLNIPTIVDEAHRILELVAEYRGRHRGAPRFGDPSSWGGG